MRITGAETRPEGNGDDLKVVHVATAACRSEQCGGYGRPVEIKTVVWPAPAKKDETEEEGKT